MKNIFTIVLFCAFSIFIGEVNSQIIMDVKHMEREQGLADRTVLKGKRNRSGYFYFFMKQDVQRYDGRNFDNIELPNFDSDVLQINQIEKIFALQNGGVIGIYKNGKSALLINKNSLRSELFQPKNIQRVLVLNGIIYTTSLINNQYVTKPFYLNDRSNPQVVTSFLPNEILLHNNKILLSKNPDNWFEFRQNGPLINFSESGQLLTHDSTILKLFKSKIYIYQNEKWHQTDELEYDEDVEIISQDRSGNYLIGHHSSPRTFDAYYLLNKSGKITPYTELLKVNDKILGIVSDNLQHQLLLFGYNGIQTISLLRDGAKFYAGIKHNLKSKFGSIITGLACDENNNVVCMREGKYAFKLHKNNEVFDTIFSNDQLSNFDNNQRVYYQKDEKRFYSHSYTYADSSCVHQFDINKLVLDRFYIPIKLNDILPIGDDKILVGGYKNLDSIQASYFGVFDFSTQQLKQIKEFYCSVRSLQYLEERKEYWIGLSEGLVVLDRAFNIKYTYGKRKEDNFKIKGNHIRTTISLGEHVIVATEGGGLVIIDGSTNEVIKQIDFKSGLNGNTVYSLIIDDDNNLWVGTDNGISVLDKNLKIIKRIYDHEGLSNREMNTKATCKDSDGNLYFGTLNGLTVIDPQKVLSWKSTFGVAIEKIELLNTHESSFLNIIEDKKTIKNTDSISIHFKKPDYYKYPFEHQSAKLTVTGVSEYLEMNVRFNKQPLDISKKGNYNICLSSNDSKCNDSMQIVSRINYSPYYNFGIGLLIVGLIAFLISRSLIRSSKKNEIERTKFNQRISDLQLNALQSQMNPHFIFNALGAIQYFIHTHDTDRADDYLSNFAMLMRNILEFSKSKYIRLSDEIKLQELYVGLEKMRFDDLFEYEISVDESVDKEIQIPPMIIQPYVENAINHGLSNLDGRDGLLKLSFNMTSNNVLQCIIEDNGIGRKAAADLRMKQHRPRGMQIVQERIATINEKGDMNINIVIIDLMDSTKALGTKIVIEITE